MNIAYKLQNILGNIKNLKISNKNPLLTNLLQMANKLSLFHAHKKILKAHQ